VKASWIDLGIRWIPPSWRYALQRVVSLRSLKLRYRELSSPLSAVTRSDDNAGSSPCRFAIVRDASQYHTNYVAACQELSVPFRVVDLACDDWLEQVRAAQCDVVLVWPDAFLTPWARMIKDRVEILDKVLGLPVVPSCEELWFYEDKRRLADWLRAKEIKHPRTWVFYHEEEADAFVAGCELPIVFKASFGAASAGVRILRSRRELRRLVKRTLRAGFVPNGLDRRDRQWGFVLLQEYLPDVKEWRLVRIGDSYFCRFKEKKGDFHSGSGGVIWALPRPGLLELARRLTDEAGFRSMDVDIFETADGRLLVNELQAVFGGIRNVNLQRGEDAMGRWRRHPETGEWSFEPGFFYQNACANERIRDVIERWPEIVSRRARQDAKAAEATAQGARGEEAAG